MLLENAPIIPAAITAIGIEPKTTKEKSFKPKIRKTIAKRNTQAITLKTEIITPIKDLLILKAFKVLIRIPLERLIKIGQITIRTKISKAL